MGIYNPKMKIPDSCWACPFCTEECFGAYKCFDVKEWGSREERAKDCPLVEVKAPHGRLIDADAVYDAVERRYRVSSGAEHRAERDFLDLISNATTVLEAEGKDDEMD